MSCEKFKCSAVKAIFAMEPTSSFRYLEDDEDEEFSLIPEQSFLKSDEEEHFLKSDEELPDIPSISTERNANPTNGRSLERRNAIRRRFGRYSLNRRHDSDADDDEYIPSSQLCATRRRRQRTPRRRQSEITTHGIREIAFARAATSQPATTPPCAATPQEDRLSGTELTHLSPSMGRRQRSTRREARRAYQRILISTNFIDQSEESTDGADTEWMDEQSIVRPDDVSIASDDSVEKLLTDEEELEAANNNNDFACFICAELKAIKPVRTTCCSQLAGCKTCVKRWYRTTNTSELNRGSPLSRGQSHDNHRSCPFCRTPWPTRMLVTAAI